jgi:hypothetical protein
VQEVKICTVLYMHQPGFAFLVGLLEVVKLFVSGRHKRQRIRAVKRLHFDKRFSAATMSAGA